MFICRGTEIAGDKPILVCGITNDLVDKLAIEILPKNQNLIRFGDLRSINQKLKNNVVSQKQLSTRLTKTSSDTPQFVQFVFATAHEAIDLLQLVY